MHPDFEILDFRRAETIVSIILIVMYWDAVRGQIMVAFMESEIALNDLSRMLPLCQETAIFGDSTFNKMGDCMKCRL